MNNCKNLHFTALLPISHDVRILADDQFAGIGYTPGSADIGLIQQNIGLIAYAGDNPIRSFWIFFGDAGFDGA